MDAKQNYLQGLRDLDEAYQIEKNKLELEYVKALNPYRAGDVIRDAQGYGEIISYKPISGKFSHDYLPTIQYKCRVLTEDKKPAKKLEYRYIFIENIIKED